MSRIAATDLAFGAEEKAGTPISCSPDVLLTGVLCPLPQAATEVRLPSVASLAPGAVHAVKDATGNGGPPAGTINVLPAVADVGVLIDNSPNIPIDQANGYCVVILNSTKTNWSIIAYLG